VVKTSTKKKLEAAGWRVGAAMRGDLPPSAGSGVPIQSR
jgi:hypothetical protein